MDPRLFFEDNLESSMIGALTRARVEDAQSRGRVMETVDGYPLLALDEAATKLVDVPLPLGTLERLRAEGATKVVLFGLGLGHTARLLRQAEVAVALIFEPDPGILRNFLEAGPSDLRGIPLVTELEELDALWPAVVGDASSVQVVDTPGYSGLFDERRREVTGRITQLLERALINDQTWRARGRTWIRDIAENSPYMVEAPSAHNLVGAFAGVPAFIVGAGPSLEKNVELLRVAAKKGIVFAVNSSGRALDRAGVEPHFLACLESIDVSHLIADLSYLDRVIRLYGLSAHPALFSTGNGPLLTLFELLPQLAAPFEEFYGQPGIPVCASVSTAALSVAQRMGCDPIVLVGQDLAYSGGRAYAKGTVYEDSRVAVSEDGKSLGHEWCDTMKTTHRTAPAKLSEGQRTEAVVAWGGEGFVHSTATFTHIRLWLERLASLLARAEGAPRLVNATEGGARIAGFAEARLADVLSELPDRDVSRAEILERARATGRQPSSEDVAALLRRQAELALDVAETASALGLASREVAEDWLGRDARGASLRLREIQALEVRLREQVARSPWVDAWAWETIDGALAGGDSEAPLDALAGLRAEGRLGDAVAVSARELAELLFAQAERLRARAAE